VRSSKRRVKLIYIALVAVLFIMAFPQSAYADTGNFTYIITESGVVITGYEGEDSNLNIPKEIEGLTVVEIGENAFSDSVTLTDIVIPEGITNIGDSAFDNCTNLVGVRFSGDAPTIGDLVFRNCSTDLVIYYDPDKNGFDNPWNGLFAEAYPVETEPSETEPIAVTGIILNKTTAVLKVGASLRLKPTVNPTDAENQNISFSSNNTDIITVDEEGILSAKSKGEAIITATTVDGGFTATCVVTVCDPLLVPSGEFAAPLSYDTIKISWSEVSEAAAYKIYRAKAADGVYSKIGTVNNTEFIDRGLKKGTVYYYKVRAYKIIKDVTIHSKYTSVIRVNTLDESIGATLFLYMSNINNRDNVFKRAVEIHYGDPTNTCAITVSEAFRRINLSIPTTTVRTNQVEDQLKARGWKREMDLTLLQPGDICFTTDKYGNYLGGHSTHVFIFMGWANKEKTIMNICDNQVYRYGSVFHTRPIFRTSLTDATAFFYHTDLPSVSSILKIPSAVKADPIAYNKVKLSWKAADSAYGYYIYRATSKYGSYTRLASARSTTYTDATVATGKTYYYMVRAYNNIGTTKIYGSYSDKYSAMPTLSAPTTLTKVFYSTKAKLSWKAVSGAKGYVVYRSTSKNGTYTRVGSTFLTSYTNSSLVSGKTYYYKVRAYRYVGSTVVYSKYSYV